MKSSCARVCSDRACGEGQGESSKKREGRGGSPGAEQEAEGPEPSRPGVTDLVLAAATVTALAAPGHSRCRRCQSGGRGLNGSPRRQVSGAWS